MGLRRSTNVNCILMPEKKSPLFCISPLPRDKYRYYPWVNSIVNCLTSSDVTTPVAFPDVNTASAVNDDEFRFEVLPGDFSDAHRNMDGGPVDAVVTSFFLDAARNPIDTVRDLVLFLTQPVAISPETIFC